MGRSGTSQIMTPRIDRGVCRFPDRLWAKEVARGIIVIDARFPAVTPKYTMDVGQKDGCWSEKGCPSLQRSRSRFGCERLVERRLASSDPRSHWRAGSD